MQHLNDNIALGKLTDIFTGENAPYRAILRRAQLYRSYPLRDYDRIVMLVNPYSRHFCAIAIPVIHLIYKVGKISVYPQFTKHAPRLQERHSHFL